MANPSSTAGQYERKGEAIMGCDIHLHIEIKMYGEWLHYNHPSINRWYDLFAKMADVRNGGHIDPITDAKGLPEDATKTTAFDSLHWGVDGHTHSWLSSLEIEDLFRWIEIRQGESWKMFGWLFGNGLEHFHAYGEEGYPKGLEDVRFVFWFDSTASLAHTKGGLAG